VAPLIEKPPPVVVTDDIVTFHVRSLVSRTGIVEVDPIATLPNDTLDGVAVSDSLVTPVPARPRSRVALDALLVNLMVPPVQPCAVGVKLTFKSKLCPGDKTNGRLTLETVNSEPLTVSAVIVTVVCPLLVTVASWVSVCPTRTSPNFRPLGADASCGLATALTGKIARSEVTIPMVRRWTLWTESGRRMDWGSRIPSSLKAFRRET